MKEVGHFMKYDKHILLLTPGFAVDEKDDFTIPALQEFVQGLIKYRPNWKISVVALHFPFRKGKYSYFGCTVYTLNGRNLKIKKPVLHQRAKKVLDEIHGHSPIDVIHSCWLGECAVLAEGFAQKTKVRHICTAMGQDVLVANRALNKLNTQQFPIVYLSAYQQERSVLPLKDTDRLIPWGIKSNKLPDRERTIDILGAGNLTPLKNYLLFLEVVGDLINEYPDLTIKLAGEGAKSEIWKLEDEIEGLDLQDNVQLLGKQSRSSVRELMKGSKVFLHTSQYESFGMIFPEALEAGCHVVSTPVGIAEELGSIQTGRNASELAELIRMALRKEAEYHPAIFSVEKTIDHYESIYFQN